MIVFPFLVRRKLRNRKGAWKSENNRHEYAVTRNQNFMTYLSITRSKETETFL